MSENMTVGEAAVGEEISVTWLGTTRRHFRVMECGNPTTRVREVRFGSERDLYNNTPCTSESREAATDAAGDELGVPPWNPATLFGQRREAEQKEECL